MRVLVTGGAGYIGSHTVLALLRAGHEVHVLDDFSNASPEALARIGAMTNGRIGLTRGDVRKDSALDAAMEGFGPEAVIHFAGKKAVGESESAPLLYYDINVGGTVALLAAMDRHGCGGIVFSSSATVYGSPDYLPLDEDHPTRPANPYGRTKLMSEGIIADWAGATDGASAISLRYFNPVGADVSARIGEDPIGVPDNLMPFIAQVAIGRRKELAIFGTDWPTRDGTGERDYIHVSDLAEAHVAALAHVAGRTGYDVCNVGTGTGSTVLEMVAAFEAATGVAIPYRLTDRRPGDVKSYVASVDKARDLLGWESRRDLPDMCGSTWAWQQANPDGFRD